jgi:protein O-GlcNAc transferase
MDSANGKPTIRILHHMARSGGTIIARCLGSMQRVTLLSEVSPVPYRAITPATIGSCLQFHPIVQAYKWHELFTVEEAEMLSVQTSLDYATLIELVHQRCAERGQTLLLRDWSHADFTAHPPFPEPTYKLSIVEALQDRFHIRHTASVRHPIDQWLSLRRLAVIDGHVSLKQFLSGYRRFAEKCVEMEFVRYDDLVNSPTTEIQKLCDRLDLRYDPNFETEWVNYSKVTGDMNQNRAETAIKKLPRRDFEIELLQQCESSADYWKSLELLGFAHPEGVEDSAPVAIAAPNFLSHVSSTFQTSSMIQHDSQP